MARPRIFEEGICRRCKIPMDDPVIIFCSDLCHKLYYKLKRIKHCTNCGKETTKHKYCSSACSTIYRTAKRNSCIRCSKPCVDKYCSRVCSGIVTGFQWRKDLAYKCLKCGKEGQLSKGMKHKNYCSRACSAAVTAKANWVKRFEAGFVRKRRRLFHLPIIYEHFCKRCGCSRLKTSSNPNGKFCKRCLRLNRTNVSERTRLCVECNVEFITAKANKKYCSRKCSGKTARRAERIRRRRCKKVPIIIEDVSVKVLFERDSGLCQICFKPIVNEPVPHLYAPTIDHIIPISKGGVHSYANTRLAHFICNSVRGDGNRKAIGVSVESFGEFHSLKQAFIELNLPSSRRTLFRKRLKKAGSLDLIHNGQSYMF